MKEKCFVCERIDKISHVDGTPYCGRHYNQIITYGKILQRTKYDKNEIIYRENFCEILLYDSKSNEIARALIDIEDIEKIINIKWHYSDGYAISNSYGLLHNLILGRVPNKENVVDHINRNRLDCRKINLHITTHQENGINKGKQSNNTSRHPGISWDKYHNKYEANIKINRKKIFLGYFDILEDAVQCRQKAELLYF